MVYSNEVLQKWTHIMYKLDFESITHKEIQSQHCFHIFYIWLWFAARQREKNWIFRIFISLCWMQLVFIQVKWIQQKITIIYQKMIYLLHFRTFTFLLQIATHNTRKTNNKKLQISDIIENVKLNFSEINGVFLFLILNRWSILLWVACPRSKLREIV